MLELGVAHLRFCHRHFRRVVVAGQDQAHVFSLKPQPCTQGCGLATLSNGCAGIPTGMTVLVGRLGLTAIAEQERGSGHLSAVHLLVAGCCSWPCRLIHIHAVAYGSAIEGSAVNAVRCVVDRAGIEPCFAPYNIATAAAPYRPAHYTSRCSNF